MYWTADCPLQGHDALTSREVALGVVEAVRIRRPLKGVPRGKVILHEAGWEAVEIVGMWWLVELWVLLVGWKGPAEVRWPLHAEGRLALATTPRWLLMLAIPGALKLAVPVGVRLAVPGRVTLAVPARIPTLFTPHALMAVVPGWAVGWPTLVVRVRRLLGRLQDKEQTRAAHEAHPAPRRYRPLHCPVLQADGPLGATLGRPWCLVY